LVMDNLNTHNIASLYTAFSPQIARSLAERLEIHHTPKHGSWLNIAEIELSVLKRQCLAGRIAVIETMKKAIVIKTEMQDIEQTSSKGNFYVQVGSFIGKPKSRLLQTISRNGLTYKIIKFPRGGKSISKLLIGPYIKRSDAVIELTKVRKNIQKDAFIAEIR